MHHLSRLFFFFYLDSISSLLKNAGLRFPKSAFMKKEENAS